MRFNIGNPNDIKPHRKLKQHHPFHWNMWYVGGAEFRGLQLNHWHEITQSAIPFCFRISLMVMYRPLEDRCLPSSLPFVTWGCRRQRYPMRLINALLFNGGRAMPLTYLSKPKIPVKALVSALILCEQDILNWIWVWRPGTAWKTDFSPARIPFHNDEDFLFGGEYTTDACAFQLLHENLWFKATSAMFINIPLVATPIAHESIETQVESDDQICTRCSSFTPIRLRPPTYTALTLLLEINIDRLARKLI